MLNFDINTHYVSWLLIIEISFKYALFLEKGWGKMISIFHVSKDTIYKIRNHTFLGQDQSVAIATTNFA